MLALNIAHSFRNALRHTHSAGSALFCAIVLFSVIGCKTPEGKSASAADMVPSPLLLLPGDIVEITFPGATNLNAIHRIGPEGSITLPAVGQVQAAGKTAVELQNTLADLYKSELRDKQVIVNVSGAANAVYVSGAVLRPGRVQLERPLTALEAIMEAGGFTDAANRKKVTVIRYEGDHNTNYYLDLDPLLSGGPVPPFYLKPRDIVHVPQKMQWF